MAVVAADKVVLHQDFAPSDSFYQRKVHIPDLSYDEMLKHRQTNQYQDFLQGPLVQGVHMLMAPFITDKPDGHSENALVG